MGKKETVPVKFKARPTSRALLMPQNRNSNSSQNLASAEPIAKEMPTGTAKKVANKKMKATKKETLPLLKPVNAEGRAHAVKVSAK